MNEQYEKSLTKLELDKVLAMLSDHAASQAAKDRCLAVRPSTDADEIRHLLDETSAACACITVKGSPSFGGLYDVGASLDRADRGGCLSPEELLRIAAVLKSARQTKAYSEGEGRSAQEPGVLDVYFQQITTNKYLEERIFTSILSKDEIADAASSELASIRRRIRQQSAKIRESLQKIITSPSYAKILQEPIVTIRSDRFVVPVKAECKSQLPGLVHDVSSSGSTYFIEPMSAVNGNNELRELFMAERKEIERILAELSAEAAGHREQIKLDYDVLLDLECIFARARLSFAMRAICPEVRTDGQLNLIRARHPLITGKTVVPISVRLGSDFDTLIITGPNTGGKTVTLKTLGLLCLMAQCGLHIPAGDQSAVQVFDRVLADVGDEQSIEQSLSTFSAHMANTVEILKLADEKSLILFDELGAGTDPVEGAALAIAIIQDVRRKGALTAATTHYAELKTFAMTTAGVENASCEFDVQTLRPTYRLLIGIPGKSNAFAISRRLGLDESVIEDAKAQMDNESVRFEDVLTQLEEKRQRLEKAQNEADRLWRQREEDARKARTFREQMEKARDNARSKGEADARRIVQQAQRQADQVFAELDELRKQQQRSDYQAVNDRKSDIRRRLNEAETALHQRDEDTEPVPAPSRPIAVGDTVELAGVRTGAAVLAVNGDGTLLLQAGKMKMTVKAAQVRLLETAEEIEKKKKQSAAAQQRSGPAVSINTGARASAELDIRGLETLEAESVVENYLDAASRSKLGTVTIIHGKGTGALRAAVHQLLKKNKQVKSFRLGRYGEGEAGVTVVELK